jgi:threonine synthase
MNGKESNLFLGLECMCCGSRYPVETQSTCAKCDGLLTGRYDLQKATIDLSSRRTSIWQFANLMPPVSVNNAVSMGEGWTPLVGAPRYAKEIGLSNLCCKLEGQNPTGSFKDRLASLGLSLAREWKKEGVFTASSGNAAAAISAYSARAGLHCLVLIREDSTASKLGQIAMYGPSLLKVRNLFGSRDSLLEGLTLTQQRLPGWLNIFAWIPFNPLLIDAQKTIAYEIAADCGSEVPGYIFVPTAGGDLLYGIFKGFSELKELGLINNVPKMVVAQGAGANPTVRAIESGADRVSQIERAETVAGALRVNFGAEHALAAVKQSRGFGVSLTDFEIISAQQDIARLEGVFTEVSSATALAGIRKARAQGRLSRDDQVCAILTGNGFKDYYPPFDDISKIPLAKSASSIPSALTECYPSFNR